MSKYTDETHIYAWAVADLSLTFNPPPICVVFLEETRRVRILMIRSGRLYFPSCRFTLLLSDESNGTCNWFGLGMLIHTSAGHV